MPTLRPLGRIALRRYWLNLKPQRCLADHCLHPGYPIQYGGKPHHPLSLDVGHTVPAMLNPTRRAWWPSETRPEHADCNRTQGARWGGLIAARKRTPQRATRPRFDTSRQW